MQDPLKAKTHRRAQVIQCMTMWQVAARTWPRILERLSFRELLPRRSPSLQHREHVVLEIVTLQVWRNHPKLLGPGALIFVAKQL